MARILPFQPRQSANRATPSGQPAAIIIFPGVRYERRVDASPTGSDESGRGRKRKRSAATK